MTDVFAVVRIIKKAGVREKLAEIATPILNNDNAADIELAAKQKGIEVLLLLIESISGQDVENEIYKLIANISDKETDEIKNCDLTEFIQVLKNIWEENDVKSFFTSAINLITKT